MSIRPIAPVGAPAVPPKAPESAQKPRAANSSAITSKPVTDTVTVSNAATAALQEATESPAQTAAEARGGDLQAQRLLAQQAASRAAQE